MEEKDMSRIITLNGEIDEGSALYVILELLKLDAEDKKTPINLYINSNGGSILHGLAIYDTMNHISAPVYTYCYGFAASMGAFLLSCGQKGHRYSLPNARILIHQPLISLKDSYLATETQLKNEADELRKDRDYLETILAKNCNKTVAQIHKDCERDFTMTAEEAMAYNIIDQIIL